jgi:lysophospholipase L1-like esterase
MVMKRISFLFAVILLVISNLSAQQNTYSTFYYQRASLLEKLPVDSTDIVFLGNSITNFGEWSELFNDIHVKNRGISGDRTTGVLARLNTILPGKPKKIFLMIGVNDLEHDAVPDSVVTNITRIAERIANESPKTTLYIQSILPVNDQFGKFPKHTDKGIFILEINRRLKLLCHNRNLVYIDLYHSFKNRNDEKLNPAYTNDGLHLMGDGYLLWISLVSKYITSPQNH